MQSADHGRISLWGYLKSHKASLFAAWAIVSVAWTLLGGSKVMERLGLENHSLLPASINDLIEHTYVEGLKVYPGPGLCFTIVLMFGYALTVRFRNERIVLVVLPFVLLWATLMLATPLSTALRYVFPMVVAIPFLVSLLFCKRRDAAKGALE